MPRHPVPNHLHSDIVLIQINLGNGPASSVFALGDHLNVSPVNQIRQRPLRGIPERLAFFGGIDTMNPDLHLLATHQNRQSIPISDAYDLRSRSGRCRDYRERRRLRRAHRAAGGRQ